MNSSSSSLRPERLSASCATCCTPKRHILVEHRTVDATPAIGIEQTVDRDDIFGWWQGRSANSTRHFARSALLRAAQPEAYTRAQIFEHSRGQATVFIPTDEVVKPIGRVVSLLIPGAELAVTRHRGRLSDIDLTYGKLGAYVIKHEISVDGSLRELPTRHNRDRQPDEWDTEIAWPISEPTTDRPVATVA